MIKFEEFVQEAKDDEQDLSTKKIFSKNDSWTAVTKN